MFEVKRSMICGMLVTISGVLLFCNHSLQNSEFEKAEHEWRVQRDKDMRSETSWLTIAGLFWLQQGENTFGSGEENNIRLPSGSCDQSVGKFILTNNNVTVVSANENLKLNGEIISEKQLTPDADKKSDILELNDLRMWVIKRGDRYAIRLRDLNAPAFKKYTGLNFFPPTKKYKLAANLVPYETPKVVTVGTVVGTDVHYNCPGYVKFQVDGNEYRLDAFESSPEKLFIIFKDETNGYETYGASRFITVDILENKKVDLNFNRAYNPPCAYTPYATCPLPPPQNYLTVEIKAGEKKYSENHK